MTSTWPSAIASLDSALAPLYEKLQRLQAVKPVDLAELIEQFKMAAESARKVRVLVSSELPESAWQDREQLDALVEEEVQKTRMLGGILSAEVAPAASDGTYQGV